MYILASFTKNKVTICAWVYLWAFNPVRLIYISVFVAVPYCLDYCSFVVYFEVGEPDSSSSIFLSQDCFGWGFPGGAVVENLPANAGDTGSSPGLGRSHIPWSNWAHEPQLLSLRVWNLCSATREATIVGGPRTAMKSGPYLPQLEKALTQKRRPNTAKNK